MEERSAAQLQFAIFSGSNPSYIISQRPFWKEMDTNVPISNYEPLLQADTHTEEELNKIVETLLILKDQLAVKFVADGIFYDKTKQAHFKILKKVGGGGDEWEAEKIQKSKDQNKK